MENLLDQILESLATNNRINLFLIDAISDEGMKCTLSRRGGRNVARQFAHLHTNRVWQLEKRARRLAGGLRKFETAEEPNRTTLRENLESSTEVLAEYFRLALAGDPSVKCFKKGPVTYLSYFIAHESHHCGNILLTLKQSGHAVDKDVRYGIWDWDRR